MARLKEYLLIFSIVLMAFSAAGLDFKVAISPTPEASIYEPNSTNNGYFNATVHVENPGSIGCKYRVRGDIQQGEQEITRYSDVYRIWPGSTSRAEFLYMPINYTGDASANLTLNYCGRSKHIGNFEFESDERVLPNKTIESRTLSANRSSALVSLEMEEAVLIPQKYPPLWKVGSEKVKDGEALVQYEPTLFKGGEQIVYTVVRNGKVEGKTTVVLEDQETWYEELFRSLASLF